LKILDVDVKEIALLCIPPASSQILAFGERGDGDDSNRSSSYFCALNHCLIGGSKWSLAGEIAVVSQERKREDNSFWIGISLSSLLNV